MAECYLVKRIADQVLFLDGMGHCPKIVIFSFSEASFCYQKLSTRPPLLMMPWCCHGISLV
jgi:hypothetical protein